MLAAPTPNFWVSFSTPTNSDSAFNQFLNLITRLDNNSNPDLWVKWKNFSHQVVIETPNFFYKLYEEYNYEGFLNCKIREILAEIYKENGVFWNITTIQQGDKIYQIEQREKLQVCNEKLLSYEDLLLSWNKILLQIEEKLRLNKILPQLDVGSNIQMIKLIRDCVNKYEDYALKDGQVILLDDADWFLGLVDQEGNWVSSQYKSYEVATIFGVDFIFAPLDYKSRTYQDLTNLAYKLNSPNNKWMLFPKLNHSNNLDTQLINEKDKLLNNTIKILSLNKPLSLTCDNTLLLPQKPLDFKKD